jgi:hypothetical protein
MQHRIGSLDQPPETLFEGYPLYFAQNVVSIEAIHDKEETFGWLTTVSENQTSSPEHYYLYIDGKPDEPFGHWVFESGIFLTLFFLLKKQYPSLQLLSFNPKKYKQVFYNSLGLDSNSVVYTLQPKNTVIFTQWNSLGDHDIQRGKLFRHYSRGLYDLLVGHALPFAKPIDILYLPRGVNENYKSNDRYIPAQAGLLGSIKSVFPNTIIYHTDTTTTISEQIHIVRSSKIILLDYGSSLLVNGYFAHDSLVVVLGDFGHIHCKNPKPYTLLQETLARRNNYVYLPVHYDASTILTILREGVETGFQVHHHHYRCWRFLEGKTCDQCLASPLD